MEQLNLYKKIVFTFSFAFFSSWNKEQGQVEIVSDSQAVLSFSPASMNFGQTVIASTKEMTLNINHSDVSLPIIYIFLNF